MMEHRPAVMEPNDPTTAIRPTAERRTVLVLSAFPLLAEGLRSAFAQTPELDVVIVNNGGPNALDDRAQGVDAVLLCCQCPFADIAARVESFASVYPEARIVVMAAAEAPPSAVLRRLLTHGVTSYLPLNADPQEPVLATSAALRGRQILMSRDDRAPVESPTPREHEVLCLVAAGCTNAQIGTVLGIGIRTVHFHIANLFAKARAHSRTQLLAFARTKGWL